MSQNFIASYLDYTQFQETTERIHRWVAISVIAAALERRVWFPRGSYTLFPNLYIFVIGPSGKVKKSTSTAIGVDMLRELPEFRIMSERVTAASLITQLERSGKTFTHCGKEIKQSPSFAYGSELNVFLGEVFGSISELLTTFYDCQPHDSSKPWVYETRTAGTTRIFGPCLNMLGASTPTWLARSLPPSELEGGFASRVIFCVETEMRRAIAWPDRERSMNDSESKRRFLMSQLKRIYALKGSARVTEQVRKEGQLWYESHIKQGNKNNDSRFSGYYARKFDTILKVALSLSVAVDDSLEIGIQHFNEALALLNDVESRMFGVFGSYGENLNAPLTERVWGVIAEAKSIHMSKLMRLMRRDANLGRLIEVIQDLRTMARVKQEVDERTRDYLYTAIDPEKPL